MAEGEQKPAPAPTIRLIDAPSIYATTLQGFFAGNDFVLVFSKPKPGVAITEGKSEPEPVAAIEPTAVIHLSPGTAKDLFLLMKEQIAQREKVWGEIETDFSRGLAAKK